MLETLSSLDLRPVSLTVKLALVTTLVLLVVSTPLALWLAQGRSRLRVVVEALVSLPLVLPPTVLGFYLLVLLGPHGAVGRTWEALGGDRLVFSFSGLVVGSVVYSLPFVVQPLVGGFRGVDLRIVEAAATLGASSFDRFFSVMVPLSRSAFLTAFTLGFAHTIGEFGVVLMLGGNIAGRTQVLSIAIYDHVEALNYTQAHLLSAGMLLFSFAVLFGVHLATRRLSLVGP